MQVNHRPASRGLLWLSEGLRIMSKQPVGLLALTFIAIVLMSLPSVIPAIGPLISVTLVPAIYVGLMHAIRACDRGEVPNPSMLIVAFRQDPKVWQQLLILGLVNAVLTIAAMGLAWTLAPGDMPMLENADDVAKAGKPSLEMLMPMFVFMVLLAPVQMAFWYAPLFVAWHQQPVGKSIFFSTVAVWRNKGAFTVLFLGWFAVVFVLMFVLRRLAGVFSISPTLLSVMISPLSLFGLAALYCSFWVTYRDVIDADQPMTDQP